MSETKFATISVDHFVSNVTRYLKQPSPDNSAAFTLLLGAGFSWPLIPTATQMVERDIPWHLQCLDTGIRYEEAFKDAPQSDPALESFAQESWKDTKSKVDGVEIDHLSGLPKKTGENIGNAYEAIMSGRASRGLNTPSLQRDYLRAVCRRVGKRINMAHVALASIAREQTRPANSDRFRRPFCRTIFTTNFDPLLQRGLQLVNQLYFMTDRPEVGIAAPDDLTDHAIHLIYTHGSIHRYFLANTRGDLNTLVSLAVLGAA